MNFTSVTFLFFFLPLVVAAYFAVPRRGWRNGLLLAASLLFYSWGEGFGIALLLVSIGMNHVFSQLIARKAQPWLAIGILANLGLLVAYKYAGLIGDTFVELGGGIAQEDAAYRLPLPLGISFFTFQAMSLLVDVSRGSAPARSLFRTGLFISLFPQLIAGPIVRWDEIRAQIAERRETWERFADGAKLFVLGLSQKVLIADPVSRISDSAFNAEAGTLATGSAWLGLAAFTIQIFFDFAGYSNMAIGMGRVFGFDLPANFRHPYSSASFQEFWRRWHMTLSRWFRDYLYIPLGGSRAGTARTYRNLLIVFLLCGLWHGAAWTFLLWGLWHGAFLVAERLARRSGFPKLPRVIGVAYTVLFVALGWVLFRADGLDAALAYWGDLLPGGGGDTVEAPETALYALAIGILLSWDGLTRRAEALGSRGSVGARGTVGAAVRWGGTLVLLLVCFAAVASSTHQPFLYFRF